MRRALACAALLMCAAAATQPPNVTVHAADEQLIYSPRDAWTPNSDSEDSVITRYSTHIKGASVAFTFNGSYVAYYTQTSSDHGPCDIMLDGQLTVSSAKSPDARPRVLLFAEAVDPAVEHTITITNANDERTTIDYFIYSPVNHVEHSSRAEINTALDSQPNRGDDPAPFGLVIGGAVGGAALLLSIITLALVVAPPDPPQLAFMRAPGAHVRARRRPTPPGHGYAHLPQQHHANRSLSLPRGESSRLTGGSSSRAHLHTHSDYHSHAQSDRSRSPAGTARHHGLHAHPAPYPNPFASTSRVDVGPSRPSSSASSSHIPLQQQGRLPPGQGFICASCSVELARERTARQRQQQQENANALWYDASGSYQQLRPARFPHQQQASSSSQHQHHQHASGSSHQASSSSRQAGSSLRPPRR